MHEQLKHIRFIIVTLFAILLAGAVVYYKQRMLFLDAPHILFRLINEQSIQITIGRYGAFIVQLLPYIGMKLHLRLQWLMILYSVSFNLFFLVIALLLLYKYKRYDLALIFAFYLTLFVSDTFFWTNNEVHEGIALLVFAFAINFFSAVKKRSMALLVPLFIVTLFLAIWTHPLIMFVSLYLWFFYWIKGDDWPYSPSRSVAFSLILLLLVFIKYYQCSHNWYDGGKIAAVKDVHLATVFSIYKTPQFHYFIKGCITNYWLYTILLLIGGIAMLRAKKYLLLLLTIIFTGGYIILVCISFADVHSLRFYLESEYMPLAIIGTVPFIYFVLPRFKKPQVTMALLFIFVIRLLYIANASSFFTSRMALLETIDSKMKQKNITKVLMPDNDKSLDSMLMMNWALPAESITCSRLNNEVPQRTLIVVDTSSINKFRNTGRDTLLGCFEQRPYSKINAAYFQLDTTAKYSVLTFAELMN